MKKILISILTVAALVGCSKSENDPSGNDSVLVPIRLGAGVEVATKAPVTGAAIVQIEGWESITAVDYTAASTWQSGASVSVGNTATAITLDPLKYYNADRDMTTYIKGWYPKVASVDGVVTFSNDNGTADILLSNAVSGTKIAVVTTDMVFAHQTAQLIFKVIKGDGLATGTRIKSITVKDASVPTAITLATDVVTYTAKSSLAVPELTAAEIGEMATAAGKSLMVEPVANNTTLKLDIETELADGSPAASYTNVPFITDDSKIEKGKAYTITLTFGQAGISIKANITDWIPAAGAGTVQ